MNATMQPNTKEQASSKFFHMTAVSLVFMAPTATMPPVTVLEESSSADSRSSLVLDALYFVTPAKNATLSLVGLRRRNWL